MRGFDLTSAGLQVTDVRGDNTLRTTDARVSRSEFRVGGALRSGPSTHAVSVEAILGWMTQPFWAEMPITFPDYTLYGPFARFAGELPLLRNSLALFVAAEAGLAWPSAGIQELGATGMGTSLGGQAGARWNFMKTFALDLSYRESHVFIPMDPSGSSTDISRWLTLRAVYSP